MLYDASISSDNTDDKLARSMSIASRQNRIFPEVIVTHGNWPLACRALIGPRHSLQVNHGVDPFLVAINVIKFNLKLLYASISKLT